ncbi:MAG: SDR family oxidoreductase [Halioglobus sp.]|nr:SDR family oxidoreductase [Halioglobus sp.]
MNIDSQRGDFNDKVVLVTGAGMGLGRNHARFFAKLGARVLVNDLGGSRNGEGASQQAADSVVAEIMADGGTALANYDSVVDGHRLVEQAMDEWGAVHVVVNNAGIIRDSSFHKLSDRDWHEVYQTNFEGSYRVTRAAWPHLRDQSYGRVIFTASAAGIYGNFGQSNYGATKLGLHGLTKSLSVEGASRNINVNTIAPMLDSRMMQGHMPDEIRQRLQPGHVSPLVAYLCHQDCAESGSLFEVGGGWYAKVRWQRSSGALIPDIDSIDETAAVAEVAANWQAINDFAEAEAPASIEEAGGSMLRRVMALGA